MKSTPDQHTRLPAPNLGFMTWKGYTVIWIATSTTVNMLILKDLRKFPHPIWEFDDEGLSRKLAAASPPCVTTPCTRR
jgi:hypothetical protein